MKFIIKKIQQSVVISFSEDTLTGGESEQLNTLVHKTVDEGAKHIIFDMNKIEYANSSGLGMIAALFSTIKSKNAKLSLVRISERVKKLMEITKLSTVISCYDTVDDALN